jgi:hypothetical protein
VIRTLYSLCFVFKERERKRGSLFEIRLNRQCKGFYFNLIMIFYTQNHKIDILDEDLFIFILKY